MSRIEESSESKRSSNFVEILQNKVSTYQNSILCKYGEFTEDEFVFFSQISLCDFLICKVLGIIIMYLEKIKN